MGSGCSRIFCDAVVGAMDNHSVEIPDRDWHRRHLPAVRGIERWGFSCAGDLCASGNLSRSSRIFLGSASPGLHVLFYGAADSVLAAGSNRIAQMDLRLAPLVPTMGESPRRICGRHWADVSVLAGAGTERKEGWPSVVGSCGNDPGDVFDPLWPVVFRLSTPCAGDG